MNDLKPWRVWHKKKKKMFKVLSLYYYKSTKGKLSELLIQWDEPEISRALVKPQEVIILMLTGKLDKNGKGEVWEKDIISYSISDTQYYKGVVEWSQKLCGFVIQYFWHKQDSYGKAEGDFYAKGFEANFHGVHRLDEVFDLEILGNVFQNPDLLEETK